MSDGDRQRRGDGAGRERDHAVERRALELTATGLDWLAAIAQAHDELAAEDDDTSEGASRADRELTDVMIGRRHVRRVTRGTPGRGSRSARLPGRIHQGVPGPRHNAPAVAVLRSLAASEPWDRPAASGELSSSPLARAVERRGAGVALPADLRLRLEARFGVALDRVRVHADEVADRAARAIGARAFTVGEDIFFAAGELAPTDARGHALLVHEVTHVIQSYQGRLTSAEHGRISRPSDDVEREAEQAERHDLASPAPALDDVWALLAGRPGPAHAATLARPPTNASEVVLRSPAAGPPAPGVPGQARSPAEMSMTERLGAVVSRAVPLVPGEAVPHLRALLTPGALVTLASLVGIGALAQLTPAGWAIDLGLAALGVLTLGPVVFDAMDHVAAFSKGVVNAASDGDLDRAADHLAKFVALVTVNVAVAFLMKRATGAARSRFETFFRSGGGGGGAMMLQATGGQSVVLQGTQIIVAGTRIFGVTVVQAGIINLAVMTGDGNGPGGGGRTPADEPPADTGKPLTPDQEPRLRAKLAELGAERADNIVLNLKRSSTGAALADFIIRGRFDEVPGYRLQRRGPSILAQLKSKKYKETLLSVFLEADRLMDAGHRIVFEPEPLAGSLEGVDIDIAAIGHDGSRTVVLQVKAAENVGTIADNARGAAAQLAGVSAETKVVAVHVRAGTVEDFTKMTELSAEIARKHPGVQLRVVFPDGRALPAR